MKQVLTGVLPIVPTPFSADGSVDFASLKKVVAYGIDAGAAALVYPGVASEDVHLSVEERKQCLSIVAEAAKGRIPVIAGVNSADAAEMVEIASLVAEVGADAIMAMAVPSMAPDYTGWFHKISAACGDLPIILQNLFAPRGANLSAQEMLALTTEVPAIRYVKEEGVPSGTKVSALVKGCGDHLDAVIGGGGARYLVEELDRGAVATMPAIELLELHVKLLAAHAAGDREQVLRIYEKTLPILLIQAPYRMRLTKCILAHRGIFQTDIVREPLPEMDEALKKLSIEFFERAMAAEGIKIA